MEDHNLGTRRPPRMAIFSPIESACAKELYVRVCASSLQQSVLNIALVLWFCSMRLCSRSQHYMHCLQVQLFSLSLGVGLLPLLRASPPVLLDVALILTWYLQTCYALVYPAGSSSSAASEDKAKQRSWQRREYQ